MRVVIGGLLLAWWTSAAAAQPTVEVDPPIVVEMPRRSSEPAYDAMAAFSGEQLLVMWRPYDGSGPLLAARVDSAGAVVAPASALDVDPPFFPSGVAGYGDGWLLVGQDFRGSVTAVPLDAEGRAGEPFPLMTSSASVLAVGTVGGAAIVVVRAGTCAEVIVLRPDEPPRTLTTTATCTPGVSAQIYDDAGNAYVQVSEVLFRLGTEALEIAAPSIGTIVAVHDGDIAYASPVGLAGGDYALQLWGVGPEAVTTVTTPRPAEGRALLRTETGWTLFYAVPGPDWRDPYSVHFAQLSAEGAVLATGRLGSTFESPRSFYAGGGATFALGEAAELYTLASGASTARRVVLPSDVIRAGSWNTGVVTTDGAWLLAEPASDDGEMRPVIIDRRGVVSVQPRIPALVWGRATFVMAAWVSPGMALARIEEPGGIAIGSATGAHTTPSFGRPNESAMWLVDVALLDGAPHVLVAMRESLPRWELYETSSTSIVTTRSIDLAWPIQPLQVVDCGETEAIIARNGESLVGIALGAAGATDDSWLIGPGYPDGPSGTTVVAVTDPPAAPAVAWVEGAHVRLAMLDERCRPTSTRDLGALSAIPTRIGLAIAGDTAAVVWTEPDGGPFQLVVSDGSGVGAVIPLAESTNDSSIGASVLALDEVTFLTYWASREADDYALRARVSFARIIDPSGDAGSTPDVGAVDVGGSPLDAGHDGGASGDRDVARWGCACRAARPESGPVPWVLAALGGVWLARRRR